MGPTANRLMPDAGDKTLRCSLGPWVVFVSVGKRAESLGPNENCVNTLPREKMHLVSKIHFQVIKYT